VFRKPVFRVTVLCVAAIAVVSLGLLIRSRQQAELTEQDYAKQYIERNIAQYQSEWPEVRIVDSTITRFEKIGEFDQLLDLPVQLWALEYRLKPDDPDQIILPGGMNAIDGLITEDGSMGKPVLVFAYHSAVPEYLGEVWSGENDLSRPAGQEIAFRKFLEGKDRLPHETFSGNHILVKYSRDTGEASQLLLSQPVKQGDQGIWAVERWKDTHGNEYYDTPETGDTLSGYYASQQSLAEQGADSPLLDPLQVAIRYIGTVIGKPVSKDRLIVDYGATAADFAISPESRLLGYVTGLDMDSDTLNFDQVEWLTLEDADRFAALNIDEEDLPGGFYILNKYQVNDLYKINAETRYELVDRDNPGSMTSVSRQEFIDYFKQYTDFAPPCHITLSDGVVHVITEQYVP
jgi:hypothetical protein